MMCEGKVVCLCCSASPAVPQPPEIHTCTPSGVQPQYPVHNHHCAARRQPLTAGPRPTRRGVCGPSHPPAPALPAVTADPTSPEIGPALPQDEDRQRGIAAATAWVRVTRASNMDRGGIGSSSSSSRRAGRRVAAPSASVSQMLASPSFLQQLSPAERAALLTPPRLSAGVC
jgi:hypothetical protein